MEGYYIIRTYEAGKIGEKTKFFVPGTRSATVRGKRREIAAIKKQEQNEYSSLKALARLLNANSKVLTNFIGLDYSDEGLKRVKARASEMAKSDGKVYRRLKLAERDDYIFDAAAHEAELVLRRVSRACKEAGIPFSYVVVTSDRDGETGEKVRVHHHLVVSAGCEQFFIEKWAKLGTVNHKPMRKQQDYYVVAKYLMDQVRRIPDVKKYRSSRNLVRVVPVDRVVSSGAVMRVPKGGQLLYMAETGPYMPQYMRYVLPRERWKCFGPGIDDGREEE